MLGSIMFSVFRSESRIFERHHASQTSRLSPNLAFFQPADVL